MDSISGITLSRRFYGEVVAPWLARAFPDLRHAAALVGYGSELLGFDDEMSRDHNWGPRVGLFVTRADFEARAEAVVEAFAAFAPASFAGFPIGMSGAPAGIAHGEGAAGDARHGLRVQTIEALLQAELGLGTGEPRDALAWLGLSEQQLLVVTAGAVFHDDDGRLTEVRRRLGAFPRDVRLYKIACQWRRIAEEQAFVGRTGLGGDALGSRIIAARLARDVIRMAFLIEDRYAPYPKWFGKAFARLPCAAALAPMLDRVLAADDWRVREAGLAQACLALARLHQARGLPGDFEPVVGPFHDRPFTVINADAIGEAIRGAIGDPQLKALPVIGSLDQVTDSTPVTQAPKRARRAMAALFDDGEAGAVEEA